MPINDTLKYAIRKAQANQEGLKLNRTHQFLAYANGFNCFGRNSNPAKKFYLLVASKGAVLEVNTRVS